jgi:NAD+ kinase
MPDVLIIAKTPLARRLAGNDRQRMVSGGVLDTDRLTASEIRQEEALTAVRAAVRSLSVTELRVDDVIPGLAIDARLVITVGGDGTVFTANTIATTAPFLTVNSDPERSVGHFTRFTAESVAAGVAAWQSGTMAQEPLHRLAITVDGRTSCILNDCLFAHSNPAVLARYVLEVDGRREFQRSSGVWVSTAHGSTAAIRSAGAEPVPSHLAALLFRVREPYLGREPATLLADTQLPPRGLCLLPAIPGMALYLDGPNITVPVAPGMPVHISAATTPLNLLAG